ncbi:hypothetical protein [Massilia consociata]|uniref:PEP-CTERM sorting domain-containing protein n=1 Tax=Massilia consociata TaxID=760117 RepID=A0ABV6FC21_9BURK
MQNKSLCGAVLALAATSAAANTTMTPVDSWNFAWTGFITTSPSQATAFWPEATLTGYFTGSDTDGDGVVTKGELSEFVFAGKIFAGCRNDAYETCSIEHFSFTPDHQLSFATNWTWSNPGGQMPDFRTRGFTRTGDEHYWYWDQPGDDWYTSMLWTDQTVFSIAPVPEPSAPALALAGLVLLAPVMRRRLHRPARA